MTVTAVRGTDARPLADDRPGRRCRAASRGSGAVTRGDVARLAATLAAVGALVGALDLATPHAPDVAGQRALETSYGVVALGHVRVELAGSSAADAGTRRVTVPVTLHNLSDQAVHYGPQHFRLHAGTTTARPEAGSVRTGEVAPDRAVQLHLVFELPKASYARLTVDDARISSGLRLPLSAVDTAS